MKTTTPDPALAGGPATLADPDMNEVLDFFPVPTLVVSPVNRVQKVSRGLVEQWNRTEGEFVGRDLYAALYEYSPTQRFDRIPLAFAIERAVKTRSPSLCQAAYTSASAAWSARIIPVFREDHLLCYVLEWDQVQVQSIAVDGELTHSWFSIDEAFRILVQTVKDYAIFLLDTRGNVASWNMGATLLKGYTKEEIIGKHFSVFYLDEELQAGKPERELEICLREGRVEDEGWRVRKDGTRFWANVVITAVYKNGVHVGFGKVTRDLTEWKRAELRLISAYEESTKLKNDFLANMSHEIRTPMHGMLSASSLLLDTPLTDEQRETANIIEESGNVMLQVINDILDYSKLASGSFSITTDVVNVASILSSVVRSVQTTLQPGVNLELVPSPDLPTSVQADPLRLRQVIQNIVGNAGKFTEQGFITVRVSLIGQDDEMYVILFEVIDTGPGVKEEDAPNLFKPFTQVDTTITKRYQGTGLGLSIAKSLVELMEGEIGYRPNPEHQGSIFWFTAKLGKIDSKAPLVALKSPTEASSDISRRLSVEADDFENQFRRIREIAPRKRILAAEDNLINQKVLVGMLQYFGFVNFTVVANGAQAVTAVTDPAEQNYDLVLMDISMPIMDGYEATSRIRSHGPRPPIIAMTAYALKGDMELCLERGMDDYIAKPVNKHLLVKKLLKWLAPNPRVIAPLLNPSKTVRQDVLDSLNPLSPRPLSAVAHTLSAQALYPRPFGEGG
ncbi:unnamed protein product [Parascedosporium putredinis]|uniref:Histidine kinase n=1 Tax=Parascedosporium putredinis TaxID=1442378 RepID=A0A9P1GZF8_9PEZI|nr:unnamed protein product [Parascedosporium putredinis]CAI7991768.1 unnamed protein product [Parascedosporium putredinis]